MTVYICQKKTMADIMNKTFKSCVYLTYFQVINSEILNASRPKKTTGWLGRGASLKKK